MPEPRTSIGIDYLALPFCICNHAREKRPRCERPLQPDIDAFFQSRRGVGTVGVR